MPLSLPAHVIDLAREEPVLRAPPHLRPSDPHALRPRESRQLMALDAAQSKVHGTVERVVPLVDSRWAVGRRTGPIALWRVAPLDALPTLGHPAWLWASDDWLDPHQAATSTFPSPARLPLRTLVAHAGALHESGRNVIKALASCVRNLRAGQPTAVIVPEEALSHAAHPGRAFALALLTLLPPAWRAPQRISIGEPDPAPGHWTLVLCAQPVAGYRLVDLDTPDDEGSDLVAFYVRERLLADDPESLEAAAFRTPAVPSMFGDPWAEAVAAVLRAPPDGVAEIDDAALERDPEGAVRALTARVAAQSGMDTLIGGETLENRLLVITGQTRDPRPWTALVTRPASERARLVQALLASAVQPTSGLVEALVDAYPTGADLGPWLDALLGWLRHGTAQDTVVSAIEHTLLAWPVAQSAPTRASVWSEVVRGLVALGEDEAAMEALLGPVARHIADDGAGTALTSLWSVVPEAFRDPDKLDALVRLLADAPDRDEALVALFRHAQGNQDELDRLFRAWHSLRSTAEAEANDALYEAIVDTPYRSTWVNGLYAAREPVHAADAVGAVAKGPDDPIWVEAEAAMTQAMGLGPGQRLFAVPVLAKGIDALEPLAPLWLVDALPRPFPSAELTDVARLLLTAAEPSPLWSMVAVTSAPVDRFEDATVDAAVVDFCAATNLPVEVQEAALACVEQLGSSDGFEPLDYARWVVRISLAPDGTRFTPELTLALVRGVLTRPDGVDMLVAVASELLELPPEHPALLVFVHFLLPRAWESGVPDRFREALPIETVPTPLRAAWAHACRSC